MTTTPETSEQPQCEADWGSATPSQQCVREDGHEGDHIDGQGHEWGPLTTERNRRADYITGLRRLADILDDHPDVPLPYEGAGTAITFHFLNAEDPKAALAACARALPTNWTKQVSGGGKYPNYFDMYGSLAGLKLHLTAFRDDVCERVVVGTHEETVEEKDPEALAAVPTVTKTITVEDVEWRCAPVLGDRPGVAR